MAAPLHRRTNQPELQSVVPRAHLGSSRACSVQESTSKSKVVFAQASSIQSTAAISSTTVNNMQSASSLPSSTTEQATSPQRSVYVREDQVTFPVTRVGTKSTVKVRVCNKDRARYKVHVYCRCSFPCLLTSSLDRRPGNVARCNLIMVLCGS